MRRLAVLIDAGYFWAQVGYVVHRKKSARAETVINYNALRTLILSVAEKQFPESILLRVYWYDGPGSLVNGNYVKGDEHTAIDELDDFKLRLGTRNIIGQQKGVDGLMIADLIGLAQNKAITDALLMSGDADLAPGVVAAQNLGLRVHLLTLGEKPNASPHLKAEVDRKSHLTDDDVQGFARKAGGEKTIVAAEQQAKDDREVVVEGKAKPAEQYPGLSAEVLRSVALSCFESLEPAARLTIVENQPIPQDVDRVLLRHGREQIRPRLTGKEKVALREELKKIASQEREKNIPG